MRIEPDEQSEAQRIQPIETVSDTYEGLIQEISKETVSILLFSSPICTPCKKIKRQIESGIGERVIGKGQFFYVNLQENGECVEYFNIQRIPHIVIGTVKEGKFITKRTVPANEMGKLEQYIKEL
jgi:thioredoxin-like negative regulator of GroEL